METNQIIPISHHTVSIDDSKSSSIKELATALSKAQASISAAKKDTENGHFKSKYADLASVWEACRAALTSNGLAVVQTTKPTQEGVTVVTTLLHSSGEWMRGELFIRPVKSDPQGIGSALTYARRYALAAMVGVAPEDDDGEGAMDRKPVRRTKKARNEIYNDLKQAIEQAETSDELSSLWKTANGYIHEWRADGDMDEHILKITEAKDARKVFLQDHEATVAGFGQGFDAAGRITV